MLDLSSLLVRNGKLHAWTLPPDAMPIAWDYSADDARKGYVHRFGREDALAFNAPSPSDADWRVVSISQVVNASPGWLRFRLRPARNYVGDAYPQAIFGIEVVDAYQNHMYYTVDSRLVKPKVYKRDRFTVNVFPGRLDEWNDIDVQLRPAALDAPFMPANATVRVNIVAAIFKNVSGLVQGDFGGASEEEK